MLTMVAALPEPPLLVPELATGASAGVRQLFEVLYSAAPHGATYHVAVWTPGS